MSESLSDRRLVENEVIFRQNNEQVIEHLKALKKAAISDGHKTLVQDIDIPLHFYCECSDEKCRQRIVLKPNEYRKLHQNSSQFIIIAGHTVPKIERVISSGDNWVVVEKYMTPPPAGDKLNPTNLSNS